MVKGFEVRSGEYVVLDDEELKVASAPKRKTVDVEHFVPRVQIDPDAYDRPYLQGPLPSPAAPARQGQGGRRDDQGASCAQGPGPAPGHH